MPPKRLCNRIIVREKESNKIEWGCLAVGRSGRAEVAVDEARCGPDRWEMSVEFPHAYLRFAIPSPSVLIQFCDFLRCHRNKDTTGEQDLESVGVANLSIINDDEFLDRFFICVLADNGAVRLPICGADVDDLIAALEQAIADLEK